MDDELRAIQAMREMLAFEPVPERIYSPAEAKSILRGSGWSDESTARVLGVSGRTVAGWVAGGHRPSPASEPTWFRLLAVLDRANGVRANRIAEGVNRLLEVVRSTPTYSETAA